MIMYDFCWSFFGRQKIEASHNVFIILTSIYQPQKNFQLTSILSKGDHQIGILLRGSILVVEDDAQ